MLSLFRSEGALCTITTPDAHDRMMAVVQGLTHFVTLCMADCIRHMGTDLPLTESFMSPVYQIELSLVGRLLSQDPSLYADILQTNPYVPEVLAACRASADDLAGIIQSGDPAEFSAFFKKNTRHFGDYCRKGQEITDTLIECMVNR
jgi:prephenate dehydrogenase